MAERISLKGFPDWLTIEEFAASRLPGPTWLADGDIRVRGKDLVVKVPPSGSGVQQAQERLAAVRQMGFFPVVGILSGTVGLSFIFVHSPEASLSAAAAPPNGIGLRRWPVMARADAWRKGTIWWKLPGAGAIEGLLVALGKTAEPGPNGSEAPSRRRRTTR